MTETDAVTIPPDELLLDPFAYQPGMASAIAGLGGLNRHPDPSYAFHTDYFYAAEGPCHFTVRFRGLSAKMGTLQLRVHMFVDDNNPRLMLGNSWRGQFNRLIQNGSEVSIPFDGFKDVRYALHGSILGGTDAEAEEVTVSLDRPGHATGVDQPGIELRNSDFGRNATRAEAMMVSIEPPSLSVPVAQAATYTQTQEAIYHHWREKSGCSTSSNRAGWANSYVLQCLKAYGMLHKGAAASGLGANAIDLANTLCTLGLEAVAEAEVQSQDSFLELTVNRDVLWSIDFLGRFGVEHAASDALALMRCLRPGGLAVHVVPFIPGLNQRERAGESGVFARADVERFSIFMISRHIETAQIKISCADPLLGPIAPGGPDVGAFGFILRKPLIAGA